MAKMQKFPIYYPGEQLFQGDNVTNGSPQRGAEAIVQTAITTRPFAWVGVRWRLLYEIPTDGLVFGPQGETQRFYPPDLCCYLQRLDQDMDITVELASQNIVIRPTNSQLVQGQDGVHYHPFAAPFPFRGGNNVNLTFKRRTSYPTDIVNVTVQTALVGWQYVLGEDPGGQPPSSGFDAEPGGS